MAAPTVQESILPALEASSPPPPLFDGTTRASTMAQPNVERESTSYGFFEDGGPDVGELPFCIPQHKYFRARVNIYMNMSLIKLVKEGLSPRNLRILEDGPFGFLVKMGEKVNFHTQVVHSLLLRRLKSKTKNKLWFKVGDKVARFGKAEFSLLTGMDCHREQESEVDDEDEEEDAEDQEEHEEAEGEDEGNKRHKKLVTLQFETVVGKGGKTLSELEKAFMREHNNSEKKLCMALILLLDGILLAHDRKNKVRRTYASALCDQRRWACMPWGHLVFQEVYNALTKAIPDEFELRPFKGGKDRLAYSLYGFPLLFQIWVYETFPDLADKLGANKVETEEGAPLCLRWETLSARGPDHQKIELLLSRDVGCVRRYLNSAAASGEEDHRGGRNEELSGGAPSSVRQALGTKKRTREHGKQQASDPPFSTEEEGACKWRRATTEMKDDNSAWLRALERVEAQMTRQFQEFKEKQNELSQEIRRMRDTQFEIHINLKVCMLRLERLLNKERGEGAEDSRPEATEEPVTHPELANMKSQDDDNMISVARQVMEMATQPFGGDFFCMRTQEFRSEVNTSTPILEKEIEEDDFQCTGATPVGPGESEGPNKRTEDENVVDLASVDDQVTEEDEAPILPLSTMRGKGSLQMKYTSTDPTKKRRKPMVGLPRRRKHSFLTKEEYLAFYTWYKGSKDLDMPANDPAGGVWDYDFFKSLVEKTSWLSELNIDGPLYHMRKRVAEEPERFLDVVLLDTFFCRFFDATKLPMLREAPESVEFHAQAAKYLIGELPASYGKAWNTATKVYTPFNVDYRHWLALEIDFADWVMSVYDPDVNLYADVNIKGKLEHIAEMLPWLMKKVGGFEHLGDKLNRPLPIHRRLDLPRNSDGCSCGVYVIKYIELLAVGNQDLTTVNDEYVLAYREKIAFDLSRNTYTFGLLQ